MFWLGSWAKPAYLAPVNPANGLFPVPAAILVGTRDGGGSALEYWLVEAEACGCMVAAAFTRCIVLPSLIL